MNSKTRVITANRAEATDKPVNAVSSLEEVCCWSPLDNAAGTASVSGSSEPVQIDESIQIPYSDPIESLLLFGLCRNSFYDVKICSPFQPYHERNVRSVRELKFDNTE